MSKYRCSPWCIHVCAEKKIADYFANIVIIFQYQIISATYSDSKGKFNNPNTLVV